jgi:Cys-tRNA(Pro)/Cys-tRNA(Cys) deacylase
MKAHKTNAARILDKLNIAYELIAYAVDENDLSATHVAGQLQENINQVFKTLVLEGDRTGHLVCVIPGAAELNLKAAAKASQNKNCRLIPLKDLLPLTGYQRGGCSPLGLKKSFPTYLDQSALDFAYIYVSAGQRGLQFKLNPTELVRATGAIPCELCL